MGSYCDSSKSNSDNKNPLKEKEIEKPKNIEVVNLIKTLKSQYIIKDIFSCLEEKTKLTIIVHNKKYQNLLGFSINYYKNTSEKLRIIEKNGICKEYTLKDKILIFEGEFKNGKKNGKAKEFDFYIGKLRFEGTYLNGKRNGKGKEYYKYDNKLRFEGIYLNGKRNGKGKEYYDNGNLKFEGEYLNDKKNGKGKEYHKNGKLYIEGEYKKDELNGKVKLYDKNGKLEFEGEYVYGKKWQGKENGEDFQGEYLNGKRWNGKGREYIYEHVGPGCTDFGFILDFEGEYINGKRKGKKRIYSDKHEKYVLKEIDEENSDISSEYEDISLERNFYGKY